MLETVEAKEPALAIFENVIGIKRFMADLKSSMSAVLRKYHILWLEICPRMLGHALARPRLYFLAIHRGCAVVDDPLRLRDLAMSIVNGLRQGLEAPLMDRLLDDDHPWVQAHIKQGSSLSRCSVVKKCQPTKKAKKTMPKWRQKHAAMRKELQSECQVPEMPPLAGDFRLPDRAQDSLEIAWILHGGRADMCVDASQSCDRMPVSFDGLCPTMTPRGRYIVMARRREICPEERLLLHGFPLSAIKLSKEKLQLKPHQLNSLAGNCMHVESVGTVIVLGLSLLRGLRRPPQFQAKSESAFLEVQWGTTPVSSEQDQLSTTRRQQGQHKQARNAKVNMRKDKVMKVRTKKAKVVKTPRKKSGFAVYESNISKLCKHYG